MGGKFALCVHVSLTESGSGIFVTCIPNKRKTNCYYTNNTVENLAKLPIKCDKSELVGQAVSTLSSVIGSGCVCVYAYVCASGFIRVFACLKERRLIAWRLMSICMRQTGFGETTQLGRKTLSGCFVEG